MRKKSDGDLKRLGVTKRQGKKKAVKAAKVLKPKAGSLAWYKHTWTEAFADALPSAAVDELARLSYENARIRERLEAVESVVTAWMFGKIHIKGNPHLIDCNIREGGKCSCGSTPEDGVKKETRN